MPKLYEALAEAFLAEGVDTQFVLMGDGNMHWSTAFARLPGVQTVHVRHEHVTVAAATAYNVATNKVAVASITCGPGVMPWMVMAPTINAITALDGIPSVSMGMNDDCAAALFADSGPATPSMAPLPKRDGSFATFFSSV